MRVTYVYGSLGVKEFSSKGASAVIGRAGADLDISPDQAASRRHASISVENGKYFVEDLNSRNGTYVNDKKITGKVLLREGDVIRVGQTRLMVDMEEAPVHVEQKPMPADEEKRRTEQLAHRAEEEKLKAEQERKRIEEEKKKAQEQARRIYEEKLRAEQERKKREEEERAHQAEERARQAEEEKEPEMPGVDSSRPAGNVSVTSCFNIKDLPFGALPPAESHKDVVIGTAAEVVTATERKLALYYEMAMALGGEEKFESRIQTVVDRALEAIPTAKRATVLMKEKKGERLLLTAHAPKGSTPAISQTLAKRAMTQREALNWFEEPGSSKASTASMVMHKMRGGIYAPLVWKEDVFGVFCMDSGDHPAPFTEDDLRLLTAISNHISMCVANIRLQDSLQSEAAMKSNLLRQFSPRVAEKLMGARLGGERAEATILCTDIRGFTQLSAGMDPKEVVEMLNEYFSDLTPYIFQYDGSVDKYVGDAILAVFGSPEHDQNQCEKAVRAALEMQRKISEINDDRKKRRRVTCEMGIGVHNGQVLHGFIGSPDRMEFTVIGETVNLAARFCDAAGRGEVVISKNVYQQLYWLVEAKPKTVKTKHAEEGEFEAYLVTGLKQ